MAATGTIKTNQNVSAVSIDAKDEGCQMTGFYGLVEKLGNKIPGPAFMFMGLFVITYIASFIR